jgi:DNA-binding transcriptional LysR family regulator
MGKANLMVSVRQEAVNLSNGEYDMAIVARHLVEQAAIIHRTLWKSPRVLADSPGYLRKHGTPQRAPTCRGMRCCSTPGLRQYGTHFIEFLEHGRPVSVLPMSSIDGDEVLVRAAALAGTGIAVLPEATIREDRG